MRTGAGDSQRNICSTQFNGHLLDVHTLCCNFLKQADLQVVAGTFQPCWPEQRIFIQFILGCTALSKQSDWWEPNCCRQNPPNGNPRQGKGLHVSLKRGKISFYEDGLLAKRTMQNPALQRLHTSWNREFPFVPLQKVVTVNLSFAMQTKNMFKTLVLQNFLPTLRATWGQVIHWLLFCFLWSQEMAYLLGWWRYTFTKCVVQSVLSHGGQRQKKIEAFV